MKRRPGSRLKTIGLHLIIAVISLSFAFPLVWMFMTSFKSPKEYYSMPPKFLPERFHIFHYREAFAPWTIDPTEMSESTYWIEESAGRVEPVVPNIINSLIVIAGSVLLSLAVGIWAAYALSRFSFKGREQMGLWILSTRMMPPIVIAVPLFWVMKKIHLVGTHLGLILIYVMIQLPFVIWMMKGFFDEVPRELEESVLLDGGTRATCIFRVVLPVAFPGIVATALFLYFPDVDRIPVCFDHDGHLQRDAARGSQLVQAGSGDTVGANERGYGCFSHPAYGYYHDFAEKDDQGTYGGSPEIIYRIPVYVDPESSFTS